MGRAALIAALAAASAAPALAQAPARIGPPASLRSEGIPAPPRKPPLAFSAARQEDGALRQGMVGSWALSPGVEAGVGLYSVTDDSRRAPETRRSWSPMDVGRRSERVAAVGLKLRF